jgi:hypothetical protein
LHNFIVLEGFESIFTLKKIILSIQNCNFKKDSMVFGDGELENGHGELENVKKVEHLILM